MGAIRRCRPDRGVAEVGLSGVLLGSSKASGLNGATGLDKAIPGGRGQGPRDHNEQVTSSASPAGPEEGLTGLAPGVSLHTATHR